MKPKIIILDRFHSKALSILESVCLFDIQHIKSHSIEEFIETPSDADYLVCRSRTKINKDSLVFFTKLKYVVSATSGFDHIDLVETKKRNIVVEYCPEANAQSAAEHTMALLLSFARKIPTQYQNILSGKWREESAMGFELSEKKLFIIGYGRIGKRFAKMARAFGMTVFFYDPYVEICEGDIAKKVNSLSDISSMDIISLHLPSTNKTHNLFNSEVLSMLKPQSVLINTSRGDVIDEKSLLRILQKKQILGACLDVFSKEPIEENSRFLELDNVVLSPHIGASTDQAFERASYEAANKLISFHNGNEGTNLLPPEVAWAKDI